MFISLRINMGKKGSLLFIFAKNNYLRYLLRSIISMSNFAGVRHHHRHSLLWIR
jgi:hypothetical protein